MNAAILPTLPPPADMQAIDRAEEVMVANFPKVECKTEHVFTPGLYTRVIYMPAGIAVTSKIHNTMHPFTILRGKCAVKNALDDHPEELVAPYFGITKPGTRRLIFVLEDTVWITYHATDKTTVEEVERDIITPHENPLLSAPCLT